MALADPFCTRRTKVLRRDIKHLRSVTGRNDRHGVTPQGGFSLVEAWYAEVRRFLPGRNPLGAGGSFSVVSGRIKAWFLLGLALLKTLLLRAVSRKGDGIAKFRENYDADGLPPVTPEERRGFAAFERCVACGLCDRGESGRMARSGGAYRGVMALVIAGSRSMPEFRAAAYGFRFVPDEVLAEKEGICPVRIPFRRVAAFVTSKAEAVGGPLPLPETVPSLPPRSVGAR